MNNRKEAVDGAGKGAGGGRECVLQKCRVVVDDDKLS